MVIKSYKELSVWKKSMELVKNIYILTDQFSKDELYVMTSQMRRAAVSIPSNIAEGYLRRHRKEFVYYLSVSLGSAAELETQILISKSLLKFKNIDFSENESLLQEVLKMLYAMIKKMES